MRAPTGLVLVGCGLAVPAFVSAADELDPNSYGHSDVIDRDVAILGGGASGTYAAINLRKMGKSVVVIEREDVLGGHVNTYTDPATGTTVDYGVQAFLNNTATTDFFAHFNVPLEPFQPDNVALQATDFTDGKPVSFAPSTDFSAYAAQVAKYPWLDTTWEVPQPVAPDLLLPFSEFITKYKLQDLGYTLYFSAEGLSNPLLQPTVNVMKMVDPAYLNEMRGASLGTVHHNNAEIYVKARTELGVDALLSSTVTSATRNASSVSLAVASQGGSKKLVRASKLLVTIPPTSPNMAPLKPDTREHGLFDQFAYMGYYTLLFNNTGFNASAELINANNSADTYHIPNLPADTQITPTRIPGIFYAWFRSPDASLSQADVEKATVATVQRLQRAQNLPVTTPTVIEYRSHTPYKLYVSAEAIKGGFYNQLYGLQGYQSTYYTGAAFISHNCGVIWNFTQALLPRVAAGN